MLALLILIVKVNQIENLESPYTVFLVRNAFNQISPSYAYSPNTIKTKIGSLMVRVANGHPII